MFFSFADSIFFAIFNFARVNNSHSLKEIIEFALHIQKWRLERAARLGSNLWQSCLNIFMFWTQSFYQHSQKKPGETLLQVTNPCPELFRIKYPYIFLSAKNYFCPFFIFEGTKTLVRCIGHFWSHPKFSGHKMCKNLFLF